MTRPGHRKTIREAVGFFAVGVAATFTHLCVGLSIYYAFDLGLSALAANLVAFCVAYLVSYFGNATLAFPDTRLGPASFFRFLAVSLVSLGFNQALVFSLVDLVGRPYWQALAAVLITVPPLTFLAMKYWGVHGQGSRR